MANTYISWSARGSGGGGGSGTVTSVDVSSVSGLLTSSGGPITSSGTIALSLNSQTANKVFASATSGGSATPSFRALVAADIPDLSSTYLTVATAASTYVPLTRTISTTAPITGGGALSSNLTIAMAAATSSVNGYLTSTDWSTFNGKLSADQSVADSQFIGSAAGSGATAAISSQFWGTHAGFSATNAFASSFIGDHAGAAATNASYSFFCGYLAGENATNANDSFFLGHDAGHGSTNALQSVFIGTSAGYSAPSAANSIFIGYFAGSSDTVDNTSAGTSIAIGNHSGTGGFSSSIAIGRGVINSATTQANIGNILYLEGIYDSNTQSSVPITTGKVRFGSSIYDNAGTPKKSIDHVNRILYKNDGSTSAFDYQNIALPTLTSNGFVKTSGGTGALSVDTTTYIASIADPNADRLFGWDDTDNAYKFITIGTGLSYDHASHTLSATGVAALTSAHIFVGNGSNVATDVALSGDATMANTGAMTLATVNSNVGSFTRASITVNAKGLVTAASSFATAFLRAERITSAQSIGTVNPTTLIYNSVSSTYGGDTVSGLNTSTGVYTVSVAGWHSISAGVVLTSVDSGVAVDISIRVTNVDIAATRDTATSTTRIITLSCAALLLAVNDTIEIRSECPGDGSYAFAANAASYFSLQRIG